MTTKTINTLVALDSGISTDAISHSLPKDGDIRVTGVVEGLDAAARSLEDTPCDILVVACSGYSDRVLFLIENAVRQDPKRPVLVISEGSPNGFVRRVFEVGADDILMLPQTSEQIRFAIQKVIARRLGGQTPETASRLVVVLGPKGGTGKTLVATNLAVALQEAGQRTVIVDLDLQFGDVALCMGLNPEKTIYDLAMAEGAIDADKVESFLVSHESGVQTLLAPRRPDHASVVTVELVREIYAVLRQQFDVIVVDTPPGFTPEVIASIDISSDLVMVGMLDSLSLKNTRLGLETLELMGYRQDDIRVVLNRARTRVGISTDDVAAVLGRSPEVLVPSDREIPRTVNEGVPIIVALPRSEPAEALRSLASFYRDSADGATPEAVGASRGRRGLRRRG
jgi:pilus assembly protein CpaE